VVTEPVLELPIEANFDEQRLSYGNEPQ